MVKRMFTICMLLATVCCSAPGDMDQGISETPAGLITMTPTPDASPSAGIDLSTNPARNIILLIGDGMGEQQRKSAQWVSVGFSETLAMDSMPVLGWARTASLDNPVTDSAASGTALATGSKTYNNFLSVDANGESLETILEFAQQQEKAVGLVSTKYISDATPGAFASHVMDRFGMRAEIASQILEHRVDVILGGGEDDFLPQDQTGCHPNPGTRQDGRDLIAEAESLGYVHVCDSQSLAVIDPENTDLLLGLFSDDWMERPYQPTLAEMTETAIDILARNPNGFFLMVEGGMIDVACHLNDAEYTMDDTVGFNEAVAVALAFAESEGDTLVIVTADHETGGMSLSQTSSGLEREDGPFYTPGGQEFFVNWETDFHSAADVPVTAFGPGAELLAGTYENTHIFDVMAGAFKIDVTMGAGEVVSQEPLQTIGGVIPLIENTLDETEVVFHDDFEILTANWYLRASVQHRTGEISIKGDGIGSWDSYWTNNYDHNEGAASLVLFKFDEAADFVLGYQIGDFQQAGYCFWGINEDSALFQMQEQEASYDPLNGLLLMTPGNWYYGLFTIGQQNDFYIRIWEANTPVYPLEARFVFSQDQPYQCADQGWWFTLNVGDGSIVVDEYYALSFTGYK